MTLTTDLVAACARRIGPQDYKRAATHFLDWLGTVLATRGTEAELAFGSVVGVQDGATVGLSIARDHPDDAAFALGALGSLLEMDDLDRTSILHAGDTVCPAALCSALHAGVSAQRFLRSILAGYEVALHVGRAAAQGGYTSWYNSSVCGVFGATMASGCAYRLNSAQQAHALGYAGMQASGIWQARLEQGHAKQLATAHAARAGLSAARAAKAGLAAPLEILEGELGFFASFYPDAQSNAPTIQSEAEWLLYEVSLKPWTACRHTHPSIAAALDLRTDIRAAEKLQQVHIYTYEAAVAFCDNANPQDAHEARFSLQHCVAVALLHGPPQRADFEQRARRDAPSVAALRQRIRVIEDPGFTADFPLAYRSTIEVTDAQGAQILRHAPHAPGDPEAPLTNAEVSEKF
ncbi:MAG: MmgE/PrpD family protein, partial [Dinoroseobacter sp.]|nr:MmgE/PrpD family protein [Dinoroseobacter sp.]